MKKLQYIFTFSAIALFIANIVYANVTSVIDYNVSTALIAASLVLGSLAGVTAVIIRMKEGTSYYCPAAIAFVLLSTLNTTVRGTLVYFVVLLAFAATEFGLVYGAVRSRAEKFTMAKYIGMAIAMLVWYLASSIKLG